MPKKKTKSSRRHFKIQTSFAACLLSKKSGLQGSLELKKIKKLNSRLPHLSALLIGDLKGSPELLQFEKHFGKAHKLELNICSDIEMREFQKKFRNLDRTTDVLSFPSLEVEGASDVLQGFMGSIVLSVDTVERNAKRYKHSFEEEYYEVYIHSFLHLLGFDHVGVSARKAKRMRFLQKQLCKKYIPITKKL